MKSEILHASTAHITQHDAELLEDFKNDLPYRCLSDEYGFIVSTPEEGRPNEDIKNGLKFSDDYIALLRYAAEADCSYVNIDRDADIIDDLNVNDW